MLVLTVKVDMMWRIRILAGGALVLNFVMLIVVFVSGRSSFLFNLFVQTLGNYVQNLLDYGTQ